MKKFSRMVLFLTMTAILVTFCAGTAMASGQLTRGIVKGNVYTNNFAQFKFQAPDKWVFSDDKTLASMRDIAIDTMSDRGLSIDAELLRQNIIYDAVAKNPKTGSSICFIYEKLSDSILLTLLFPEQLYLENTKKYAAQLQNHSFIFGEMRQEKLGQDTYSAMDAQWEGIDIRQTILARKINGYMLVITFTFVDDEETFADFIENFV